MSKKRWADMTAEEKKRARIYNYMRAGRMELNCELRAYARKIERECDYSDFEFENNKRFHQLGGKIYGQKVC